MMDIAKYKTFRNFSILNKALLFSIKFIVLTSYFLDQAIIPFKFYPNHITGSSNFNVTIKFSILLQSREINDNVYEVEYICRIVLGSRRIKLTQILQIYSNIALILKAPLIYLPPYYKNFEFFKTCNSKLELIYRKQQ